MAFAWLDRDEDKKCHQLIVSDFKKRNKKHAKKHKLTKRLVRIIETTVLYHCSYEFATMLNPESYGPNWNWDKFVEWCIRRSMAMIENEITNHEINNYIEAISDYNTVYCSKIANMLLEQSCVKDWWKNENE